MIKYTLLCANDHEFEIWFDKGSDYDRQAAAGLVICPHCGIDKTSKAPMAPYVKSSRARDLSEIAARISTGIEETCTDVGDKFADEARAMYYGEKPEQGIYGQASPKQAKELGDEGIDILPLPPAIAPKPKNKLN